LGSSNYSDVNKDLSALKPEERAIVELLREGERLVDQVIAELDLPAGKVSSLLTMLAIKGIVKKLPGNRVCLK
jgi:DNA processing protein